MRRVDNNIRGKKQLKNEKDFYAKKQKVKFKNLRALSIEYSISVVTLRKFVKLGLPHYKVGRKILVKPEDFETWFEQYKVCPVDERRNLKRIFEKTFTEM